MGLAASNTNDSVELGIVVPVAFLGAHGLDPIDVVLVEVDLREPLGELPIEVDADRRDACIIKRGADFGELGPGGGWGGDAGLVEQILVVEPVDVDGSCRQHDPVAGWVERADQVPVEVGIPDLPGVGVGGATIHIQVDVPAIGGLVVARHNVDRDVVGGQLRAKPAGVLSATISRVPSDFDIGLAFLVGLGQRRLYCFRRIVIGGDHHPARKGLFGGQ